MESLRVYFILLHSTVIRRMIIINVSMINCRTNLKSLKQPF